MPVETQPALPRASLIRAGVPHGFPRTWSRIAAILAFASLTAQQGFPFAPRVTPWFNLLNVLLAIFYTLDLVLALRQARKPREVFSVRRFEFLGLCIVGALLLWTAISTPQADGAVLSLLGLSSTRALVFALVKLLLLGLIGIQALRLAQRLFVSAMRPELALAASFGILIALGTLLLLLPNSTAQARDPVSAVDALFTATSAACVTGLVVRDTGTDFSTLGQMIILALFQVGGLGIISFVAFLSVFSQRALPVPQMILFRQAVNAPAASDLKRQFLAILLATCFFEVLGAFLLLHFCPSDGDFLKNLHWSVFHAVSAFCNAGFALQADSLTAYAGNTGLILSVSLLIVLGGLGFLVLPELLTFPRARRTWFRITRNSLFRRMTFFRWISLGAGVTRLSVQAKLALTVMSALLLVGFAGFLFLESNHLLAGKSWPERLLSAWFQSVTARTAGFNTVPIDQLQAPTVLLIMILMVIGANPVSTGGGIKTVSFGILLLALRAMITRRDRVEAFGRTLPVRTLLAALSVFGIYVISAVVGVFLLSIFDSRFTLQQQVFEVISALSTVGLSMGITPELSVAGKLVICAAMFIGRVGPIALVLSVFHARGRAAYEFPEEEVVVG